MVTRRKLLQTAAVGIAGCAGAVPAGKTLSMQLDWKLNAQFAGLALAEADGLYRAAGLNVALRPWRSGLAVTAEVAERRCTVGCAEQNLVLAAQAEGAPLRAIATMFQESPLALMSPADRPVGTLAALRGHRVGMHIDGLKVMELCLGTSGLEAADISVAQIPYEGKYERLRAGDFSAIQCYAVDEPIAFESRYAEPPKVLALAPFGHEAYAQVLFTHEAELQNNRPALGHFLKASFAGWRTALATPERAVDALVNHRQASQDVLGSRDYQLRSLKLVGTHVLAGIEGGEIGTIDPDRWQRMAERFARFGVIASAPALDRSLDTSLWPA